MIWRTFAAALFVCLWSCGPRIDRVDKTSEDGVEVVINHLEPYKVKGQPSALELEQELVIDTEKEEISSRGLSDVTKFDIDSKGNIYLFQRPPRGLPVVFKFNPAGEFVKSFGQVGEGPGEIQYPFYLRISREDEVTVWDSGALKRVFFDPEGNFLREVRLKHRGLAVGRPVFLDNGNLLALETVTREGGEAYEMAVNLYDAGFKERSRLCRWRLLDLQEADKISAYPDVPLIGTSRSRIYVGTVAAGYEISIYGLEGKLLRKIRKEYRPIGVPESLKAEVFAELGDSHPFRNKFFFPENMPALQYLFADDEERLYVVTSEKTADGKNICDIFSREGVFFARQALGFYDLLRAIWQGRELDVIAKKGRIYCLREKASGYKELVISRMRWF